MKIILDRPEKICYNIIREQAIQQRKRFSL